MLPLTAGPEVTALAIIPILLLHSYNYLFVVHRLYHSVLGNVQSIPSVY